MTFDPSDFLSIVFTFGNHIQTANGECVSVDRGESVDISLFLYLKNCLLIFSLSHKLLSVSQLTKNLNCTILMTYNGCIVQDAQTGTIIGRGTEKGGLYYVEEAIPKGHTSLAHGSPDLSIMDVAPTSRSSFFRYLKHLFPSLSNCNTSLNCESCVLATSH